MADSCFLDFEKLIKGESKRLTGLTAIEVRSWDWGISHSNRGLTASKAGRPDVKDFIFRHYMDTAAPVLMQYCAQALPISRGRLAMHRQGGTAPQQFLEIVLTNVRVLSADTVYEPGLVLPEQEVRLSFSQVEFWYMPRTTRAVIRAASRRSIGAQRQADDSANIGWCDARSGDGIGEGQAERSAASSRAVSFLCVHGAMGARVYPVTNARNA